MTPYSSKKGNSKSERRKKNTKEIVVKKLRWCLWDKVKVGGIVGFISGFGFGNFNIKSVYGKRLYSAVRIRDAIFVSRNNNWLTIGGFINDV